MSKRDELTAMEDLARALANLDYNDRRIVEIRAIELVGEDIGDSEPQEPLQNRRIRYPIGSSEWCIAE